MLPEKYIAMKMESLKPYSPVFLEHIRVHILLLLKLSIQIRKKLLMNLR